MPRGQSKAPISTVPEANTNPAALSVQEEADPAELEWYIFDSSRINEAAYDRKTETLYVRFVKPQPVGTPWIYEGVATNEWKNLKRSASPGRFVNRILNQKDYHRGNF